MQLSSFKLRINTFHGLRYGDLPFYLPGQEIDIRFERLDARENYIAPTIKLEFERLSKPKIGEKPEGILYIILICKYQ
jgi:hypothetical protein